jgi:hypothetical protein
VLHIHFFGKVFQSAATNIHIPADVFAPGWLLSPSECFLFASNDFIFINDVIKGAISSAWKDSSMSLDVDPKKYMPKRD